MLSEPTILFRGRSHRVRAILSTIQLALLLGAEPALGQTATQLDHRGTQLLREGKFEEAIARFKKAVAQEPGHALAHFGLARARAARRSVCTFGDCCPDVSYSSILDALRSAIKLRTDLVSAARKEPDFRELRRTFYFQTAIVGLSPDRDLGEILKRVEWFSPRRKRRMIARLEFARSGRVIFSTMSAHRDEGAQTREVRGAYTVDAGAVQLVFRRPVEGSRQHTGKLDRAGKLAFAGAMSVFDDDPRDCDYFSPHAVKLPSPH